MFWGLIMEPQRRYSQKVKKSFHISMAALDMSNANDEPAQIMCCYEGRNYLLCTLKKPDMIQCPLDLNFEEGSEISFASNGKSHVHLTGYLTNELDLLEEEADEEEDVEGEGEDEKVEVPSKKKKKQKTVLEVEPPKKKSKLTNSLLDISAEEDEDDEDFEIEEEESDDGEVEEEEDGSEEESDDEEDDDEEEEPVEQPKVNGIKKENKAQASKKKEKEPKVKEKKQQKESPKKTFKKMLQAGVFVEDLKEGEGPVAKNGKYVNVYYEGRLKNSNKVFDSSLSGPGFKFRLGGNEVIKGWDIGLVGMKQGGKRRISCPPNAAYGAKGSPPVIPPNATLVFEVELLKVK